MDMDGKKEETDWCDSECKDTVTIRNKMREEMLRTKTAEAKEFMVTRNKKE